MNKENYFTTLNNINVSDKTEQKNGLTYLSRRGHGARLRNCTLTQITQYTKEKLNMDQLTTLLTAKQPG